MANLQVPDRFIAKALALGIGGISSDTDVFDEILDGAESTEIDKAKAWWVAHPPAVRINYPHADTPLPCVSVVLASESPSQDYIGQGEAARMIDLGFGETHQGFAFKRRLRATWGVHVFSQNPDTTLWAYRAVRFISNVAVRYWHARGFAVQVLDGQDLIPDPNYALAHAFVRRLTLALEWEERWTDQNAVWTALNGDAQAHLTADGTLLIRHEDAGGGVSPYTAGEEGG